MNIFYMIFGLITLAVLIYLFIVLFKPEWF